jgi:hypothetical protein
MFFVTISGVQSPQYFRTFRQQTIDTSTHSAESWARENAKPLFGKPQPDWHVFPHAEGKSRPDPTVQMGGWRSAWRSLTRAIQCSSCEEVAETGAQLLQSEMSG